MRILVDLDKCIGAGQCVRAAGAVFAQDEDSGLVIVLDEDPPEELRGSVQNAARLCPARAIVIDD